MDLSTPHAPEEVIVRARRIWWDISETVLPEPDVSVAELPCTHITRGRTTYKVHGIPHVPGNFAQSCLDYAEAGPRRHRFFSFLRQHIERWDADGELYLCEQGLARVFQLSADRELHDYSSLVDSSPEGEGLKNCSYPAAMALLRAQLSYLARKPGYLGLVFREDPELSTAPSSRSQQLAAALSEVNDARSLARARFLYSSVALPVPIRLESRRFLLEAVRSHFPTPRYDPCGYAALFYWISPDRELEIAQHVRKKATAAVSRTVHVLTGLIHESSVAWYLAQI
jgi:hypothetical protein